MENSTTFTDVRLRHLKTPNLQSTVSCLNKYGYRTFGSEVVWASWPGAEAELAQIFKHCGQTCLGEVQLPREGHFCGPLHFLAQQKLLPADQYSLAGKGELPWVTSWAETMFHPLTGAKTHQEPSPIPSARCRYLTSFFWCFRKTVTKQKHHIACTRLMLERDWETKPQTYVLRAARC